jgi:predicted transcriptional regulator YheO
VKNVYDDFDELCELLEMFSMHMGENCEVVLHDTTSGLSSSIVKILNGHVTGRKVGGPGTNLGLEVLKGDSKYATQYNYINQMSDGRMLRSSTMSLQDSKGRCYGAICVNQDITDLVSARSAIETASGYIFPGEKPEETSREVFVSNVGDLVSHFIQEWEAIIRKPVAHMSREEKIQAVKFFDDKGTFLISRAGDQIKQYLNISKFTLYQYLDIARKDDEAVEVE